MKTPARVTFRSKSGLYICVRWLREDDTDFLVNLFENMSSDSRYRRFLRDMDHLNPVTIRHEVEHIVEMHPDWGIALIAFADLLEQPNAPVAVARYVTLDDERETAELAISVRDDQQDTGIGPQLVRLLNHEARAANIQMLIAFVQAENRPMLTILYGLNLPTSSQAEFGVVNIEIDLTPAKPGVT